MKNFVLFFYLSGSLLFAQDPWQSSMVYYDINDNLVYERDQEGNIIPDFSYAGYRNGDHSIPTINVVKTIQPISGDNTAHIQNALFEVALMPKDENGFRGAVLLEAGIYEVYGTINFGFDGVVLRGVGDDADSSSNTILLAKGNSPSQRTVIIAGGGNDTGWDDVADVYRNITNDSVLVGEHSFTINNILGLAVGDNIIIEHPCTAGWLQAIDYGGTHSGEGAAEEGVDIPWEVGSLPITYNRYITEIVGNTITIDAPVYNDLIKSQAQSRIYKYARQGLLTNIGIENLRIDIEAGSIPNENHAWNALDLVLIEDAWVKECTFLHFGLSGVRTKSATRVTIENCNALDPVAVIEGGKMYNFNASTSSQLILFKNCLASNGRHHYMSNGKSTTSGIVFVDCNSQGAYASSEGHRRWSQALLYDNFVELDGPRSGLNPRLLGLYNRGYYGTSHGWSAAHSVAWNCDVNNGYLIVQKPPTAQNYAIGCSGSQISGVEPYAEFDEPEGFIEGSNIEGLEPRSLYYAQLEQRHNMINSIDSKINSVTEFKLFSNYPNPFNPSTTIKYSLFKNGYVKLTIYDVTGKKISDLVKGNKNVGVHTVNWNSKKGLASGVYFYQLQFENKSQIHKMMLLK